MRLCSQAGGPSNVGFTPLITLKRPGTVNATRTHSSGAAEAEAAAAAAASGATGNGLRDARAPGAGSAAGAMSPHGPAAGSARAEDGDALEASPRGTASQGTAHYHAGASVKTNGPVYGASYPPEMIEAMMQESNAKHAAWAGVGGWGGGRPRATRLAALAPSASAASMAPCSPTPSFPEPSAPASAQEWHGASSGGDEEGGEPQGSRSANMGAHSGAPLSAAADGGPCLQGHSAGDGLAWAVVGRGQSNGQAEAGGAGAGGGAAGTGAVAAGVAAHGLPATPGSRDAAATPRSGARTSRDYRTVANYERVLKQQLVDLEHLQQLCWSGCPAHLRPMTWRLLLRYAPGELPHATCAGCCVRQAIVFEVVRVMHSVGEASASVHTRLCAWPVGMGCVSFTRKTWWSGDGKGSS